MQELLLVLVIVVPLVSALTIPLVTRFWRGGGPVIVIAALAFCVYGAVSMLITRNPRKLAARSFASAPRGSTSTTAIMYPNMNT